ncbi:MAG: sugar phosphate isomerase [Armatimonadetes bacterium]|nr:sugar phosphate isomerase [Armatimonadota bacterium]
MPENATTPRDLALAFCRQEAAFRLGKLPTEAPHPGTTHLAELLQRDLPTGIALLQAVDRDIPAAAARVFAGEEYARLCTMLRDALAAGRRITFTGCGATGRLSILLEAAWRAYTRERRPDLADRVFSVMAGGDFALVRSVEGFEDFPGFGRHQLTQTGVSAGDAVVSITEGGETPFVIGTAWQALEAGAQTAFVFNNPAEVLAAEVQRSREVIEEPGITKLMLFSGPMAVAGSTRMQATTFELLAVGAALGAALEPPREDPLQTFIDLLDELEDALAALTAMVELEEPLYRRLGLVTYFAHDALLDIFTDTTERSPTFMLPGFRRHDDLVSPRPWAFVKHPLLPTPAAWQRVLGRPPRCLAWTAGDYAHLDAPEALRRHPPRLGLADLLQFRIGCEPDPTRFVGVPSAAVLLLVGDEVLTVGARRSPFRQAFGELARSYGTRVAVCVGPEAVHGDGFDRVIHVPCHLPPSPLRLWEHLAAKLVLNTVSTATMGRLGRLMHNWMVHVNPTNKKLIDRGTRLIMGLTGLQYEPACVALHRAMAEVESRAARGEDVPSPVWLAVERERG